MGPDLAFTSSHSHAHFEGYGPLPVMKSSSIHRLPHEDGEIRDISPAVTNSNSKPSSVPPPIVSSTEPPTPTPAVLPPHPNLLCAHSTARLPPRPTAAPPPPLTGRGTPPGQGRRRTCRLVHLLATLSLRPALYRPLHS